MQLLQPAHLDLLRPDWQVLPGRQTQPTTLEPAGPATINPGISKVTLLQLEWEPSADLVRAPYDSVSILLYVPKCPGVYILSRQRGRDAFYSFYVGQTDNLYQCFIEHLLTTEPNPKLRQQVKQPCGFQYALVKKTEARRAALAALYWEHPQSYPCNHPQLIPTKNPHYKVVLGL